MSNDQSKEETKLTQQLAPVTTDELTDADLEKAAGGALAINTNMSSMTALTNLNLAARRPQVNDLKKK